MGTQLDIFFRKNFSTFFTSYDEEWTKILNEIFAAHRDTIVVDVRRKYPALIERADFADELFRILELDAGMESVILYRLQRGLFLRDPGHAALPYLARLMKLRTGAEIYYSTAIGAGFRVEHGPAIVVGPRNIIGDNFTIHQGVTIGQRTWRARSPVDERVTIENSCVVFAGAKILGAIRLGKNVRVAANAVLLTDAEENSTYAGAPARKVRSLEPLAPGETVF